MECQCPTGCERRMGRGMAGDADETYAACAGILFDRCTSVLPGMDGERLTAMGSLCAADKHKKQHADAKNESSRQAQAIGS